MSCRANPTTPEQRAGAKPAPLPKPPFLCLVGPTATGKSAVAIAVAQALGGEIISVDSMQVYRGMDLGTAKPGAFERGLVPHHLIDIAEPDQPFDAAQFVGHAQAAVAAIRARGRVPVFCGGTGLYLRAWLEGLGAAPATDPGLRTQLEAVPLAQLCRELETRDPVTFRTIDLANPRRVIRAVEAIRLSGRPYSELRARWSTGTDLASSTQGPVIGLARQPEDLRTRIDVRVDQMFAAGLVQETRGLLERGLERNRNAMQAIGYRQVLDHLRGLIGLDATIVLVKTKTRQFAKRQYTWFRRQPGIRWLALTPEETPASVAGRVLESVASATAPTGLP